MKELPSRSGSELHGVLQQPTRRTKPIKTKRPRFDTLVARYYPAVYRFASRLTDDPLEAVFLTHDAFNSTRKQLGSRRSEVARVTILLNAVIRAGLTPA
jgi:DNA-directed RNA polymerase specialized sigma24 family protein